MSVVNCKVAYIRPEYNNLREWMADPNNIYVGRANIVFVDNKRYPPSASPFANPFTVKDHGREGAIIRYIDWIKRKLLTEPDIELVLLKYYGKNLGCWCAPHACHAHVLLDVINKLAAKHGIANEK